MAHPHAEFAGQPGTGLTAECSGYDLKGAREARGALGTHWQEVGQSFRKRAAGASRIIAEKAAHMQQQANRLFTDRQVARGTAVAAMYSQRWLLTARTLYVRLIAMGFDDESHIDRPDSINGKTWNEKWQNRCGHGKQTRFLSRK